MNAKTDTLDDVETQAESPPKRVPAWSGRGEFVLAAIMIALAVILFLGNNSMRVIGDGGPLGPQGAGWLIGGLSLLVAVLLIVAGIRKSPEAREEESAAHLDTNWVSFLIVASGLILFTALLQTVGWIIMATALFWIVARGLGDNNWLRAALVGFTLACVIQIVFSGVLDLSLPSGIFGGN